MSEQTHRKTTPEEWGRITVARMKEHRAQFAEFDLVIAYAPQLCPCALMDWAMTETSKLDEWEHLRDLPTRAERERQPGRCYCSQPARGATEPDTINDIRF